MPAELLDKREVRIRRMFGEIAPWYDFLNHLLSLNIDKRWRTRTAKLVPPGPPECGPILDLCTGTGDLALAYDRAAHGHVPIVAADFCHEMLVRATRKAREAGRERSHSLRRGRRAGTALPDRYVSDRHDRVRSAQRHRHGAGIAEMVRVTRPGGRVAILEFSKPRHWLFGRLYRWYFRYVLPLIGQILCRNARARTATCPRAC